MSLPYKSIAIETNIEFVNLQPLDINPLMSKCDVKVFYIGKNRNQSCINKDVATTMAKTLRGCPIVGYYKEQKEDFADHGEQVIFDDEGIHFNVLTKPYGFIDPNASVWFQDFEEQDKFGNSIIRKYLCTTGYIWTGQFEEAKKIFDDNGKPQSMELDKKSLQGSWSEDIKDKIEFFIISDAIFSKLCILGDDVEPCYEGSSIQASNTNFNFTLDKEYKNTLFNMMKELQFALKGENQMPNNEKENIGVNENEQQVIETPISNFSATQDNLDKFSSAENKDNIEKPVIEFKQTKKEDESDNKNDTKDDSSNKVTDEKNNEDEDKDEEQKKKASKSTLQIEYEQLLNKYTQIQQNYQDLQTQFNSFRNSVEDQKKDELIAKFYMLSDEDKKEIIENKSKYSYDEIEQKLAVIGFKKGVNFSLCNEQEQEQKIKNDNVSVSFNLNEINTDCNLPDWIQAVKETEKQF